MTTQGMCKTLNFLWGSCRAKSFGHVVADILRIDAVGQRLACTKCTWEVTLSAIGNTAICANPRCTKKTADDTRLVFKSVSIHLRHPTRGAPIRVVLHSPHVPILLGCDPDTYAAWSAEAQEHLCGLQRGKRVQMAIDASKGTYWGNSFECI
jgi:hypothetical protein